MFFHRSDQSNHPSYVYGSLQLYTAIVICLEHSFWIKQGSSSSDNFIMAWEIYLKTQRALVDEAVDNYLRSKGSNDWFTIKYLPSEEERAEIVKIVFNNLLCKSGCLSFELGFLILISKARPKTSS